MNENQRKAVELLIDQNKDDPENIALILCGSIARKEPRNDSDIDLYLVVSDEKFERTARTKSYFYGSWDPNAYFGVGVDGKIIDMRFLEEAALHASDPTRESFRNAYAAFSRKAEIEELIRRIHVYPEWEHEQRIKMFYAYVKHFRYTGEDAFKHVNEFESRHCIMELVFFAARLVLAHNRVLFPCHKSLFSAVGKCNSLPADFVDMSLRLVNEISLDAMIEYYEIVIDFFREYDYSDNERIGLILTNEWTWLTGRLTAGEW